MGSGGVVVMDEDSCMVDVAKFFLEFTKDESCGKCTPCRAGIPEMLQILNKISKGTAALEDLDTLEELAEMVASGKPALIRSSPQYGTSVRNTRHILLIRNVPLVYVRGCFGLPVSIPVRCSWISPVISA